MRELREILQFPQSARPYGTIPIGYPASKWRRPLEQMIHWNGFTDDQYRRILAVNVDGVVFGARALVPELIARGGGALVATASLAGLVAFAADPVYALTKHAVVGLVRALALTLTGHGITVTAVCPGLVDTPLVDDVRDALAAAQFPLIAPGAVVEAVLGCMLGEGTGQAVVVQAGREPTPFRFARPPGPRQGKKALTPAPP